LPDSLSNAGNVFLFLDGPRDGYPGAHLGLTAFVRPLFTSASTKATTPVVEARFRKELRDGIAARRLAKRDARPRLFFCAALSLILTTKGPFRILNN
jgi:hypothetical protein